MNVNRWKNYFEFSKKERVGIISLLIILAVVWFLPLFFVEGGQFDEKGYDKFRKDIAQLTEQTSFKEQKKDSGKGSYHKPKVIAHSGYSNDTLFYFDPNTLSKEGWQRLGISQKTVTTIQNYRARGGRFYKAEDIKKIYGLREEDYGRLLPYIQIAAEEKQPYNAGNFTQNAYSIPKVIDINTADTAELLGLPGIGSKLAQRIVSFREKLGGFYSVEQLAEVYGLKDSIFQKIRPRFQCNALTVKKIPINVADLEALKAHPYIKYQLANAVIQYRLQHGKIRNKGDLLQIHLLSEQMLVRLEPYISYQE